MAEDGIQGWQGNSAVDRRTFLRGSTGAAIAIGSLGTSSVLGDRKAPPIVTTRGHFRTTWYREVQRSSAYGPEEYETDGSIPGLETDENPDELLVFAHGWLNKSPKDEETFETAADALRTHGYDRPVVGFSYDADTLITRWWQATEIAERNGPKLSAFLDDLVAASPETTVRLVGHSLGGRVVLSGLQESGGANVGSVSLLGAAVNADNVAVDGEYGGTIGAGPASVDNFFYEDDAVLDYAYSLAEWESAVGQVGCVGPQPETYTDHDAAVDSHFDFYDPDDGCMDQVVETFE